MKRAFGMSLGVLLGMFFMNDATRAKEKTEPGWSEVVKKYYPEWEHHYWVDRELWGNRGYLVGGPSDLNIRPRSEAIVTLKDQSDFRGPITQGKIKTYVVKKGDCLWYIAGYPEIYGNPLRWPLLFKANQDQITDPDLIYPGQVLVIPQE